MTLANFLAALLAREVIDLEIIDTFVEFYIALSSLIVALWARGKVISENKVVAWVPDPLDHPEVLAPGPVSVTSEQTNDLIDVSELSATQAEFRANTRAYDGEGSG